MIFLQFHMSLRLKTPFQRMPSLLGYRNGGYLYFLSITFCCSFHQSKLSISPTSIDKYFSTSFKIEFVGVVGWFTKLNICFRLSEIIYFYNVKFLNVFISQFFCFHIMKGFHVHVCSKFLQSKDVLLKLDFLRPLLRRIRLVHLCLESYPNICDFPHVIVIHVIKCCRGDRLPTEKLHIWRYCLHIFLEAFSFCSTECF